MTGPAWTCEPLELAADGAPGPVLSKPLTVGDTFLLRCSGEAVDLDSAKLALKLPKPSEYALRLLEARSIESGAAVFVATSYQVGEHKLEGAELGDGSKSVRLDGLSFKVASVLNPQQQPPPQPFGPPAPRTLDWPVWVWIALALAIAVLISGVSAVIVQRIRRKRFFAELARAPIAVSPYANFNRELRQMFRAHGVLDGQTWTAAQARAFFSELDRAFRWFAARELAAHCLTGPAMPPIARALRQESGSLAKHEAAFGKAFAELERAMRAAEGLSGKEPVAVSSVDGRQIANLCRMAADQTERALRKRGVLRGLAERTGSKKKGAST